MRLSVVYTQLRAYGCEYPQIVITARVRALAAAV